MPGPNRSALNGALLHKAILTQSVGATGPRHGHTPRPPGHHGLGLADLSDLGAASSASSPTRGPAKAPAPGQSPAKAPGPARDVRIVPRGSG